MRAAGALLLVVAAAFLLAASAVDAQEYGLITNWGSEGSGNGQFQHVEGIATDPAGNVYVAGHDTAHITDHRIQKFTSNGTFLTKWGNHGVGDGEFAYPADVATDAVGNVYVVNGALNGANAPIQKFTSNGTFITSWGTYGFNGDPGTFWSPSGIATDAGGDVYVADDLTGQVQKFTSDGTFLTKWGSKGAADGQFNRPRGIATDAVGNVYVADENNNRIQKFTSNGAFLTKWGSPGFATPERPEGQFNGPTGVATDLAGNVFVADNGYNRIQKFSPNGFFITEWGTPGSADGQFHGPQDVVADAAGNVYVAELHNHRIQKFGPLPPQTTPTPTPQSQPKLKRPKLKKGPKGKTKKRKAVFVFRFRSPTPGARFQCRLTGQRVPKKLKRWRRCRSPKRYKRLRPGKKVFWVRASLGGQVGKPDKRKWRVL